MCLILLAWRAHPEYPLIFAGNRDETYERPSAPADFWSDDPRIFGGRDLEKGGTWLGLTLSGRMAAVTNYRERPGVKNAPRSRGDLTARFLRGDDAPRPYLERTALSGAEYAAFSLLAGDGDNLWYHSNRASPSELAIQQITPGVHGLSNHLIDTPWPKVASGKLRLGRLLDASAERLTASLFDILLDRTPAADLELPDTGIGLHRERELSPIFIAADRYGTRASTVVLIDRTGAVQFTERAFGPHGAPLGVTEREFQVGTATT